MVWGVPFLLMAAVYWIGLKIRSRLEVGSRETKCVFITGCDSGFGRFLALRLDSKGVPVFAGCLTVDGASSLRMESTPTLKTVQLDVTKQEDVEKAIAFVKQNMPQTSVLWGLVNNAGITGAVGLPCETYTTQDYLDLLSINLIGMVRTTNAFLPLLTACGGRILNTSCLSGTLALPGNPAYVASKFAVFGWTEALRREKSFTGIHVASILPGAFPTEANNLENIWRKMKKTWMSCPTDLRETYGEDYLELAMRDAKRSCDKISSKSDYVVDAYEHALFSRYPGAVYRVGTDARFAAILLQLPRWIQDWVLSKLIRSPTPRC